MPLGESAFAVPAKALSGDLVGHRRSPARLLVGAVATRDYPVVQAVSLVLAVFVLLVNVLTAVVHRLLDPRLAVAVTR